MKEQLISVIIPIYNAQEHLRRCLEGVAEQTYKSLEIILTDDGSTDNSAEICGEFAEKDSRFVVIRKENGGAASARNAGLEAASGDLIGFVDSDDLPERGMFEYLAGLAESGADIVQCGVFYEWGKRTEKKYAPTENITVNGGLDGFSKNELRFLANSNYCKLFRSGLLKTVRFDERFSIGEDLLFNIDALKKADKVVLGSEPMYHYIIRDGSLCRGGVNGESLLSYRNALEKAIVDNAESAAAEYYFEEKLRNDLDIFSKLIASKSKGYEALVKALREEIKANMPVIKRGDFSGKEKLKFRLSAKSWGLYKGLLPVYKRIFGG